MSTVNIHKDKILILDFGSQYTQLLARRVREAGVYCELWAYDVNEDDIKAFAPKGIILSGSPESTTQAGSPRAPDYVFHAGVPVLGICYGMQTMAVQLGGAVSGSDKREYGYAQVNVLSKSPLIDALNDDETSTEPKLDVWMSHGDKVTQLPKDFEIVAKTDSCSFAMMQNVDRHFYGLQFHPEVTHSKQGFVIIERFVHEICGCQSSWTPENIIEDAVLKLKKQIGETDEVILGLSGGVDSSVTALLLHRAIGSRLTCVFIDHGLLRLNEAEQVMEMFGQKFGLNIIHVNAETRFLDALKGEVDPEAKRKIIGREFVAVFDEEAAKQNQVKWLAQGTIYPDIIESAAAKTGKAHLIKSHHNVGGLPEDMKLGLVEPLKELFKDEVRKLGLTLGLPYDMLYRHPFPGPGLGVRVLGEIKKSYCDILRKADAIFIEELYNASLYHQVSQAFTVFLPVRSVGVMGDGRRYDWVVSLRAVETIDFMTARWAHLPYDFLGKVSNRIINEVEGISRVVYDISGKPPATIEWE
ncbi:glutamine-hydrolyzing GMP synthase [Thorsellia kenyensis]|uniref:GMP synthase [glutamine-hydrolyzing] n=1 Tax=Thorsellia kenyensis TaxID=1549888 RepID=A0ABV6C8E2_9GAMM